MPPPCQRRDRPELTRGTVASAASVGENEGNSESQKKDASNERHFGRWITRTKDGVVSRVSRARGRKEESCEPALPDAASLYTFRPIPSRRLAAERQGADTDPPLEASSFVPEEASVAVTRQRDELHSVGMSASHSCLSVRRPGGRARKRRLQEEPTHPDPREGAREFFDPAGHQQNVPPSTTQR